MEEVSWFQDTADILEKAGKLYRAIIDNHKIYILIDFDGHKKGDIRENVINELEATLDIRLRQHISELVDELKNNDISNPNDWDWELDEYGMQIVKEIWIGNR